MPVCMPVRFELGVVRSSAKREINASRKGCDGSVGVGNHVGVHVACAVPELRPGQSAGGVALNKVRRARWYYRIEMSSTRCTAKYSGIHEVPRD